tara:strand:+ start:1102 stop:1569 length:468 start_codon:yes stop_codon:yes gene_type:complete
MKVTKLYTKKEYTCKKCDGQVYYGQITDDEGKTITTDGSTPNGKFGKESNVLSGAVDANNKTKFHECYLSNLQQKFRDATNLYQEERPVINNMPDVSKMDKGLVSDFLVEANDFYQRASPTASKFCGGGATAKDVHITLMGMMHDFFAYKIAHMK